MDILQGIILVVLCFVIVSETHLPTSFRSIGIIPLSLLGLVLLGCLFINSPVLGIVGIVAIYVLIQSPKVIVVPEKQVAHEPFTLFKGTLEEEMVNQLPGIST